VRGTPVVPISSVRDDESVDPAAYGGPILGPVTLMSDASSRTDATAVCEDAFAFAYPLVLMELTRIRMTSVQAPDPRTMRAPPNQLVHARGQPRVTLRTSAWLDLAHGPVVLSVPDSYGRYRLMSLIDMWTSVFASVGARTTGTGAGRFAIGLRGMSGSVLPPGVLPIASPTRHVRIAGQTWLESGDSDAYIRAVESGYRLTPLSGGRVAPLAAESATAAELVDRLDARAFFRLATRLLADNPPRPQDRRMIERARHLGLFTGGEDVWTGGDSELQRAVERGASRGRVIVRSRAAATMGEACGRWHIDYRRGRFGTDYVCRAATANAQLDVDVPEDALPALTCTDADGWPLTGSHRYVLRFGPDAPPPVHGFWDLRVQGAADSLGDRDGLTLDGDGSLPIYIQRDPPAPARRSNWLPAPPGDFTLILRLYWPRDEVLRRRWTPPAVAVAG
jgi:hypothetical protein